MTDLFSDDHTLARDADDPLRALREEFLLPRHDGRAQAYFCGNSLGLQPRGARAMVDEVLDKWATQAVEGHFLEPAPWMPYHALVRDGLAGV
ncbi:MAG TPA: kynureninase, partial [Xanthomonadaceae bacterium]|nr:kynureninase [Xanthomonadaceae bacterium]